MEKKNLPVPVNYEPAVSDPLTLYLREVNRYPRLSQAEEKALALKYINERDLEAAKKLTLSNLWLVVRIAKEYESAARNVLDLIQEGNMGLMEAVKNFDPYKEVRFPSYASWWIKAYIIRFIIANGRLVRVGTTQAQRKLFFNLKKEKERLERAGLPLEPKLIAERLQVKESEVIEMDQRLSGADLSFDTPVGDGENTLLSMIPSEVADAEQVVSKLQAQKKFKEALDNFTSTLSERDRAIFEKRILAEEKSTLQELSDQYKLSKERIRQLEERIKEWLREYLEEKFGTGLQELDIGE